MSGAKPLQASRKSVTKILGLFKKYEEQDSKKKISKKNKSKSSKPSDRDSDKTTESVIKNIETNDVNSSCNKNGVLPSDSSQSEISENKERPRSLLFEKMKHLRNGAKSDTVLNEKESKVKSKLPVNSFRRSLNLENLPEPPKFYKNPSKSNLTESDEKRPDKKNLKLDLNKTHTKHEPVIIIDPVPSTSSNHEDNSNRNSLTTTDDSSTILSPSDDYMSCDSWSVCSDLHSPLSPNGHVYSGDENESVIDRIRRKSFYTRFNEKKRTRKPNLYKDLELGYKSPTDYSSLDRKSYDYRNPVARRSSFTSTLQEPSKTYRPYNRSSSLMNDYVNMPNRYQTYSSKIGRPVSSLYSDSEDNALDDLLSTANSRKYSSHTQASRLGRTSVSPVNEYYADHSSSSIVPPASSEPV
ncbi:hypothetical protein JTB14_003369 [Gonioctena quinquepunctata]|nr:hypothetical protein JTB14_003369 [Gonioctena quinquepunctata]